MFGDWLRRMALQWEPLTADQVKFLADKAEENPRIAHFLRERIETHGELASRDYETAWTMHESGVRSEADMAAEKRKVEAENRLSAALKVEP